MTIKSYESNLTAFFMYLQQEKIQDIESVEKGTVKRFILMLKAKEIKNTTINTYLRATRAFLYFAMREEYLDKFDIKLIKADKQPKEPYTDEEITKLLKRPNFKTCGFAKH